MPPRRVRCDPLPLRRALYACRNAPCKSMLAEVNFHAFEEGNQAGPSEAKGAILTVLAQTLGLDAVRDVVEIAAGGKARCEHCKVEADMCLAWTGDLDLPYDHNSGMSLEDFFKEGVRAAFRCRVELAPGTGAACGRETEVRVVRGVGCSIVRGCSTRVEMVICWGVGEVLEGWGLGGGFERGPGVGGLSLVAYCLIGAGTHSCVGVESRG